MRTILYIIQKEFKQIFRNKSMLPIIFFVPVVQLIILVHAATFEMKQIKTCIIDFDHSSMSRELSTKFQGSPFFRLTGISPDYAHGEEALKRGRIDVIINISKGFEKAVIVNKHADIQLVINAINGVAGGLVNAYSMAVITEFAKELNSKHIDISMKEVPHSIPVTYSFWYNPELNYKTFMVPGILVLLITIISLILSGMNIVREKEIGTIEQINVTPIHKYQFIIGKLLPFLFIALFELAFGLLLGRLLFHIPVVGNLLVVFTVAVVYIIVILGMGLLVSTMTNTQQQAMLISFFFLMIFILMSGLFTAIENMPYWARVIDKLNPVAYFIRVMRMVLLKGSGFADILNELFSLLVLACVVLSLAVWRYRKTNG
jgi:ABC-2 type transport system permease protein